jgi:predicted metal-binding protein
MIGDVWKKMGGDPATDDYTFKEVVPPSPDEKTMKKCRELCAQNLCGSYGTTWGCPPGVGTAKECLRAVRSFSKAVILIKKFGNIDMSDGGLLERLCTDHQNVCRKFGHMLKREGYSVLPLSDGGCRYCGKCTYPDAPCRFPEQIMTSLSCYGIMMGDYLKTQNLDFAFEDDSVTLYGLILYNEPRRGNDI